MSYQGQGQGAMYPAAGDEASFWAAVDAGAYNYNGQAYTQALYSTNGYYVMAPQYPQPAMGRIPAELHQAQFQQGNPRDLIHNDQSVMVQPHSQPTHLTRPQPGQLNSGNSTHNDYYLQAPQASNDDALAYTHQVFHSNVRSRMEPEHQVRMMVPASPFVASSQAWQASQRGSIDTGNNSPFINNGSNTQFTSDSNNYSHMHIGNNSQYLHTGNDSQYIHTGNHSRYVNTRGNVDQSHIRSHPVANVGQGGNAQVNPPLYTANDMTQSKKPTNKYESTPATVAPATIMQSSGRNDSRNGYSPERFVDHVNASRNTIASPYSSKARIFHNTPRQHTYRIVPRNAVSSRSKDQIIDQRFLTPASSLRHAEQTLAPPYSSPSSISQQLPSLQSTLEKSLDSSPPSPFVTRQCLPDGLQTPYIFDQGSQFARPSPRAIEQITPYARPSPQSHKPSPRTSSIDSLPVIWKNGKRLESPEEDAPTELPTKAPKRKATEALVPTNEQLEESPAPKRQKRTYRRKATTAVTDKETVKPSPTDQIRTIPAAQATTAFNAKGRAEEDQRAKIANPAAQLGVTPAIANRRTDCSWLRNDLKVSMPVPNNFGLLSVKPIITTQQLTRVPQKFPESSPRRVSPVQTPIVTAPTQTPAVVNGPTVLRDECTIPTATTVKQQHVQSPVRDDRLPLSDKDIAGPVASNRGPLQPTTPIQQPVRLNQAYQPPHGSPTPDFNLRQQPQCAPQPYPSPYVACAPTPAYIDLTQSGAQVAQQRAWAPQQAHKIFDWTKPPPKTSPAHTAWAQAHKAHLDAMGYAEAKPMTFENPYTPKDFAR